MTLRRSWASAVVAAILGVTLALMIGDAVVGDDWPGWDEGLAVVAFPLGIPLAVTAGLDAARGRSVRTQTVAVTAAVWAWGALVFVVWLALG